MKKVIVIGLARSGTSVISRFLSESLGYCLISEPHVLWRSGTLMSISDEVELSASKSARCRNVICKFAEGSAGFVEKSPINVLRPKSVYQTFPDAIVVYVQRDKDQWVRSNLGKVNDRVQGNISVLFKKYLIDPFLDRKSSFNSHVDAGGDISLFRQASIGDWLPLILLFFRYSVYRKLGILPFGPKLNSFPTLIENEGIESYYEKIYARALDSFSVFRECYDGSFIEVSFEDFKSNPNGLLDKINSVDERIKPKVVSEGVAEEIQRF